MTKEYYQILFLFTDEQFQTVQILFPREQVDRSTKIQMTVRTKCRIEKDQILLSPGTVVSHRLTKIKQVDR